MLPYVSVLLVIAMAIGLLARNYIQTRNTASSHVPEDMASLASIIRNGANVFMRLEYRVIMPVVLILAGLFTVFIEVWAGVALILGACMSSISCTVSMKGATYANVGTANTARLEGAIGETQQVAVRGGSIGGLSVPSFGLLGVVIAVLLNLRGILNPVNTGHGLLPLIACNPATIRITAYSLGCSVVAMFNRVAGGNFTKAADISADIVGKNRHNLEEDDQRNPCSLADFVGDNVNDVAGNCSDLLESFVASCISGVLNAVNMIQSAEPISTGMLEAAVLFPIVLSGVGLLSCIISIIYALAHRSTNRADHEIDMITYIAAGSTVILGALTAYFIFGNLSLPSYFRYGWASPWLASILGIISGVAIGKVTEYYTSLKSKAVRETARYAVEGVAFSVSKGEAAGWRSCLASLSIIAIASIIAFRTCGYYGVSTAALGMLSFVGSTVTIDAFGPIADNAGGIAESCHLDPHVREITDELDALGNTTAAVGKGLAINSAAFATLSLLVTYVSSYANSHTPTLNAIGIYVIAGLLIGIALVPFFSAYLSDNTIDSAYLMAQEGERQLSIPEVAEGKMLPNYEAVITMATNEAIRKMRSPSMLAIIIPIIGGITFGPEFVGGLVLGALLIAIPMAIYMSNTGGIFDNAKKYIEAGLLPGHGKGSDAHKAAVAGDTIGDIYKDVNAVAFDIFIKMMSTVSNIMSPIFAGVHIF